jgi:magnesium chelatase family protein
MVSSIILVMGELSLDGERAPDQGRPAHRRGGEAEGLQRRDPAEANAREAAIVSGLTVTVWSIPTVVARLLRGTSPRAERGGHRARVRRKQHAVPVDIADVRGQENIKRAFEIAAAGGHNVIMIGRPARQDHAGESAFRPYFLH